MKKMCVQLPDGRQCPNIPVGSSSSTICQVIWSSMKYYYRKNDFPFGKIGKLREIVKILNGRHETDQIEQIFFRYYI